jgi:iron complex outermembrane receptor protein
MSFLMKNNRRRAVLTITIPAVVTLTVTTPVVAENRVNHVREQSAFVAQNNNATNTWITQASPNNTTQADADPDLDTVDLPPVTVEGTRPAPSASQEPIDGYRAEGTSALGFDLPLQQTPATVNVISNDFLRDSRATRLDDVVNFIPGVTRNDDGGWTDDAPLIRGFDGTTIYLNGLRFGGSRFMPDNVERIEVIKGPAGVEAGVAEPGGTINVVTKKPQRFFTAAVEASLGDYGYRKISGDVTGPLALDGDLQYRLIGAYEEGAEWRKGRPDETPRYIIAPSLNWDFAPGSNLLLEYEHYYRDDAQDRGIIYLENAFDNDFAPRDWSFHQENGKNEHTINRFDIELNHRFNDLLSARLRYQYIDYEYKVDEFRNANSEPGFGGDEDLYNEDGLSWNGNRVIAIRWADWFNEETQHNGLASLKGEFNTGDIAHTLLGGVNILRNEERFVSRDLINENDIDIFDLDNDQEPNFVGDDGTFTEDLEENIDSYFGQWQAEWTSAWRTIVGVRYDEFDAVSFGGGLESEEVSFRVATSYDLRPNHTVFAGYSDAYQPQEGVSRSGPLDPTHARSFEIGLKSSLAGGRLLWSNTVYQIRQDDISADDPTNTDEEDFLVLIGSARIRGFESEITGNIGDNLRLLGGIAFMDTEILDNPDGFEGNRFPNTPRFQASLFANYTWARFGLPKLDTLVGVIHVGDREGNSGNTITLPDYTVVDLGASYRLTSQATLSLFVENVFDETYYVSMQDSGARADQIDVGDRRLIQGSLRYEF